MVIHVESVSPKIYSRHHHEHVLRGWNRDILRWQEAHSPSLVIWHPNASGSNDLRVASAREGRLHDDLSSSRYCMFGQRAENVHNLGETRITSGKGTWLDFRCYQLERQVPGAASAKRKARE